MKKILTLLILVAGTLLSHAQKARVPVPVNSKSYWQHFQKQLRPHKKGQAAKTTAVIQRVIATSGYSLSPSASLVDSANFRYYSSNGSSFDLDNLLYNYYYPQTEPYYGDLEGFGKTPVMADSIYSWGDIGNGVELLEQIANSFTATGGLADMRYNYLPDYADNYKVENIFDVDQRVVAQYYYFWTGTAWDSSEKRYISYNAQDEILTDTFFYYDLGDWIPYQALENTYVTGNLVQQIFHIDLGFGLMPVAKAELDYYLNNFPKTIIVSVDQGTGYVPVVRDSMAFSSSGDYTVYDQFWSWDGLNWVPENVIIRSENLQGLPDSVWYKSWDGTAMQPDTLRVTSFNSYDNPVESKNYTYNAGWNYDFQTHYYYETFNTAVANVSRQADMKVYPNPVNDRVNIDWKNADTKPVTVSFINAAGQILLSETLAWKQQSESFSTAGLSGGMYWIVVKDNSGAVIYKQSVLKQ